MARTRLEYEHPVMDAETAAQSIEADATLLTSGSGGVAYPKAVPSALASSDRSLALTVITGGTVGDEIDVDLVESGAVARRFPYQNQAASRDAINDGRIAFHDQHLSQYSDKVEHFYRGHTVAVVEAIAVGEDWFVPSLAVGPTPAYVDRADELLIELNDNPPLEVGDLHDVYRPGSPPEREPVPLTAPDERIGERKVRFDPGKLRGVVRTGRTGSQAYSFRDPTEIDEAIAGNFIEFLKEESRTVEAFSDTICLQFGAGSLGNALMGSLKSVDVDGRDLVYYGEIIMDGLLDMIDAGKLKSASATALALSDEGQQRLVEDIQRYAEDIVLRPSGISNDPSIITQFGVIGVNSALEVDIYGHANSTHVNGTHLVNGVGGSGNFIRNGFVGVVALPSVTSDGTSRIVPMVPHVDHTEQDIDIVITEQGVADLRFCSPLERAERLIASCAHPDVRDDLRSYLDEAESETGGHIPHDLTAAVSWHLPDVERPSTDGSRG